MVRDDFLFGAIAVREGFISEAHLRECLRLQNGRPLGETLVAQGRLTGDQVQAILDIQHVHVAEANSSPETGGLFGQIALTEGFITPDHLHEAVREQLRLRDEGRSEPIGEILCRLGHLTPLRRQEVLRKQDHHALSCPQCDTVYLVHDHAGGTRFVCRRCLCVLTVPDPSSLSLSPSTSEIGTIGPYQLLGELGRGSMAVVFKARHRPTGALVALKVLRRSASINPGLLERFQREVRVGNRVFHPNIIPIRDAGEADGLSFIALEYVEGVTLRRTLRERRLRLGPVLRALVKCARAVHHVHQQGVVHRDLKPANIVLDGADEPHIMDFGLARIDRGEPSSAARGASLGTPFYMSPEQACGDLAATDGRSDVYSLGVILYESLAGRVPFTGPTAMAVFRDALSLDPLPPSQIYPAVPPEMDAVALKAFARDREDRYATADKLAGDLHRFLESRPEFDPPLPPRVEAPPSGLESTG
jgi:predicted Ser/Thr protein kinase